MPPRNSKGADPPSALLTYVKSCIDWGNIRLLICCAIVREQVAAF
jgi:hypothetical protein